MKYFVVDLTTLDIYEYVGVQDRPLDDFGIDWIVFRALSVLDAKRQAELYISDNHPIQADINRIGRTIRVLASDDQDKARKYFDQHYPVYHTVAYQPPRTFALKLEAIDFESGIKIQQIERFLGESGYKPRRPWVAEITGFHDKYKFDRSFLKHRISYEDAYSQGDRGVYFIYELFGGKIYEVNDLVSRKRAERYYCKIVSDELVKISYDEVVECLKNMGLA